VVKGRVVGELYNIFEDTVIVVVRSLSYLNIEDHKDQFTFFGVHLRTNALERVPVNI
jgi:hypothetical protein